jgi:hypothetical protein
VSGIIKQSAAACLVVLSVLALGCGPKGAVAPAQVLPVQQSSSEPGEIELSDAKATLADERTVRFEVKYRFTKGKPDKYYSCDISFPGTANHGVRTMSGWELQAEGVIKDGIELRNPPVKSFEIRMSEAVSPQDGYKGISNVASGQVE